MGALPEVPSSVKPLARPAPGQGGRMRESKLNTTKSMSVTIGHYQDVYPRGYVLNGWDPQNPTKLTTALPVAKETTAHGQTRPQWIWPGMVITPTEDGAAWKKGVGADETPTVVAIAQDASEDPNVIMARRLVGLMCSDDFEIASPFFARHPLASTGGEAIDSENEVPMYTRGLALTYCKAGEVDKRTVDGEEVELPLDGFFRPAQEGEPVIGIVSSQFTGVNGSQEVTSKTVAPTADNSINAAEPLQETFETTTYSHCLPANAYMVHFQTTFRPAAPTKG